MFLVNDFVNERVDTESLLLELLAAKPTVSSPLSVGYFISFQVRIFQAPSTVIPGENDKKNLLYCSYPN